ncbi:hypothetical protein VCR14J2_260421 [Vibrio coralliirubri]|nr:hypothetical protein VCR14J2_260421 [Vibrio coralliirubri]
MLVATLKDHAAFARGSKTNTANLDMGFQVAGLRLNVLLRQLTY